MSSFIIGDLHGCYTELRRLLELVNFNENEDTLICVGDLVNRGPDSLGVLRYLMRLPRCHIVLGNHDLHLLALHHKIIQRSPSHRLRAVIETADIKTIVDWLIQQPLALRFDENKIAVHAGIPPQWSPTEALYLSYEVQISLQKNPTLFLKHMYGNNPTKWCHNAPHWDRLRYITNALTRMRLCHGNGELVFNSDERAHSHLAKPWFDYYSYSDTVFFGHWAALNGKSTNPKCIALDTGCVWGNMLTAYHLETERFYNTHGLSETCNNHET